MRMTTDKLKLQTDEHVENLQIQFNHKTEEILVKTTEQLNVTADQVTINAILSLIPLTLDPRGNRKNGSQYLRKIKQGYETRSS